MKKTSLYISLVIIICGSGIGMLLTGCLKNSDPAAKASLDAIPSTSKDLVQTLAGESNLQLFYQAFNKLSLAGSININSGYTIFAPTDSAMKAAGLDAAGINSLNIDSLRKLISYQIEVGSLDDKALKNSVASTQILSLQKDLVLVPATGAQYLIARPLFVSESDALYLNGTRVLKSGPGIQASNGFIYPVNGLISNIPGQKVYDIIASDPELSMYKQALMIGDSLRITAMGYDDGSGDVASFSNQPIYTLGMLPTVLAPTNKAFNDAGFHTIDDIRQYATRSYVGYDLTTYSSFYYSALDSVLKHHIIYNIDLAQQSANNTVRVFYNDLLNPAINNNIDNNYKGGFGGSLALKFITPLIFSNQGGTVNVKWNNDPSSPSVALPQGASLNNSIASNGALYKIDKLFYPAVK